MYARPPRARAPNRTDSGPDPSRTPPFPAAPCPQIDYGYTNTREELIELAKATAMAIEGKVERRTSEAGAALDLFAQYKEKALSDEDEADEAPDADSGPAVPPREDAVAFFNAILEEEGLKADEPEPVAEEFDPSFWNQYR